MSCSTVFQCHKKVNEGLMMLRIILNLKFFFLERKSNLKNNNIDYKSKHLYSTPSESISLTNARTVSREPLNFYRATHMYIFKYLITNIVTAYAKYLLLIHS